LRLGRREWEGRELYHRARKGFQQVVFHELWISFR